MLVRAAADLTVPMEHNPRWHIGAKPIDVPNSTYYRRRLAAGELIRVEESDAPAANATGKTAQPSRKNRSNA